MAARIRRDAWKLPIWDPTLLWYARAVRDMRNRISSDPRSWGYQAAIHDFVPGSTPHTPPLPPQTERTRFWRQCQHFCWFFLPWHRMYLLHFERIVAETIVQLGGPEGWALPYWNYSDTTNPDARRLPHAFRELTMPDGSDNPLRIDERDAGNDGAFVGEPADVDVCPALRKRRFVSQGVGGDPGFGGSQSGFNHGRGFSMIPGEVERVPHGSMHGAVGGFMGGFDTAGLDPLFWLHHANIDRLWEVWRRRDPANTDPIQPLWLTGVTFPFHDRTGQVVTHTSSQFVDLLAPLLDYEYEDVSNPCLDFEAIAVEGAVAERQPEMVGATYQPVQLGADQTTTEVALSQPSGPMLETPGAAPEVFLNIENIIGSGKPVSYAVYVNVPEGDDPEAHPELFAGILPMFGLTEASQRDAEHAGSGLQYTLDITAVVRRLEAQDAWDPRTVRVSFVPRRAARALLEETPGRTIQVGRVSVYVG
jgi:tyrosinase